MMAEKECPQPCSPSDDGNGAAAAEGKNVGQGMGGQRWQGRKACDSGENRDERDSKRLQQLYAMHDIGTWWWGQRQRGGQRGKVWQPFCFPGWRRWAAARLL